MSPQLHQDSFTGGNIVSETTSLRDQQAEFTKQLLLEAARKVIIETSPEEFTMQKVAQEAGVSHRTVYRYFPSRQALIDEFSNWLESRFDNSSIKSLGFGQIDEVVRTAFDRFDRHSAYFEAAARLSGGVVRPANQADRTIRLRKAFDEEFPDLDPETANRAFSMIRHLIGLQTWYELRDRFGLKDGETGEAAVWAARAMVDALRAGHIPSSPSHASDGTQGSDTS
jgi:AcrR family transcriptional regulator